MPTWISPPLEIGHDKCSCVVSVPLRNAGSRYGYRVEFKPSNKYHGCYATLEISPESADAYESERYESSVQWVKRSIPHDEESIWTNQADWRKDQEKSQSDGAEQSTRKRKRNDDEGEVDGETKLGGGRRVDVDPIEIIETPGVAMIMDVTGKDDIGGRWGREMWVKLKGGSFYHRWGLVWIPYHLHGQEVQRTLETRISTTVHFRDDLEVFCRPFGDITKVVILHNDQSGRGVLFSVQILNAVVCQWKDNSVEITMRIHNPDGRNAIIRGQVHKATRAGEFVKCVQGMQVRIEEGLEP